MLSRSLLDPRHFRMDDLLRRPYTDDARFGSSGPNLLAVHPDGWGLANGFRWQGQGDFGLFGITIDADGKPVTPGEAVSRPSHLTLHGVSADGGLQVTEDKFITDRDVAVSVLSLRNAGLYDADVRIIPTWHLPEGEQTIAGTPAYVLREAPPGDDLRLRLPSQSYRILTFLVAVGRDRDAARRSAWSVFEVEEAAFPRRSAHYVLPDANPLLSHVKRYQQWFNRTLPRFDCPDPWLMKLWYHGWHEARRSGARDARSPLQASEPSLDLADAKAFAAQVRAAFVDGDFDRPRYQAEDASAVFWPGVIEALCGLGKQGDPLVVEPSALASGWEHFCLEDVRRDQQRMTLVWDDPASPVDAYDDGDKGVSLYVDGEPVYQAATLDAFSVVPTKTGAMRQSST